MKDYFLLDLIADIICANEIILANWPKEKHFKCNRNIDIPVIIPSLPCSIEMSALCNYEIEAKNHFLLESLPACPESPSILTMYLTVILAFVKYFDNWNDSLETPVLLILDDI